MQIISLEFLLLVIIGLGGYYLLPRKAQHYWLLGLSLYFLYTWSPSAVIVLTLSIFANYYIGRMIWRTDKRSKAWFWIGMLVNIGAFIVFRLNSLGEFNGFFPKGHLSLGPGFVFELNLLLPIGFSYYCLQAISYLIDIKNKQIEACNQLEQFAVYMAYFPRLLSGPIERARNFIPQLNRDRVVDNEKVSLAVSFILSGLIRKLIIANPINHYIAEDLFLAPAKYSSFELVLGWLFYSIWIYNDFAGYTSIIRGVSLLFGIELAPNFQTPFLAKNFSDFWNRWHISLSHWLRDYIYFPLTRWMLRKKISPKSIFLISIPPMTTMLISGLWHNFGAYMLAWGGLHGLYQTIEKVVSVSKSKSGVGNSRVISILSRVMIFLGATFAFLPFASGSLSRVGTFLVSIVQSSKPAAISTLLIIPVFGVVVSFVMDAIEYSAGGDRAYITRSTNVQTILLAAAILMIGLTLISNTDMLASFVYQGF